jgi:hypothetical protein
VSDCNIHAESPSEHAETRPAGLLEKLIAVVRPEFRGEGEIRWHLPAAGFFCRTVCS